jgi:hypothetical protein
MQPNAAITGHHFSHGRELLSRGVNERIIAKSLTDYPKVG